MDYRILVINTGSTSTKFSIFEGAEEVYSGDVDHNIDELKACKGLGDQVPLRRRTIDEALAREGIRLEGVDANGAREGIRLEGVDANAAREGIRLEGIDAIAARGGTFGSVKGGAYEINDDLIEACEHPAVEHASCVSALLAAQYAKELGVPSYIYDAVCTDEIDDVAKMTGIKGVLRKANCHTLNTRAVARAVAAKQGRKYEDMNFVVCHMGGGDSINVQSGGRIVDIVSDDEGPMSPERSGAISALNTAELCYGGEYPDYKSFVKKIHGNAGLVDYLGTKDMREIEKMLAEGNQEAQKAIDAMVYQTAKAIASMAAVVDGNVDSIILTGGCMHRPWLAEAVKKKVEWIAPVEVIPGAYEMKALALGIGRVLNGEEKAETYVLAEDKAR